MVEFIKITAVSVNNAENPAYSRKASADAAAAGESYDVPINIVKTETFSMALRKTGVSGYNRVSDAPEGSGIQSLIYTTTESGLPQLFTTLSVPELDDLFELRE